MSGLPLAARLGLAAVTLALYAALSAWIVAGEGASYRRALASKSVAARAAPPASPPDGTLLAREADPTPTPVAPPSNPPESARVAPKPDPAPAPPGAVAGGPAARRIDPFWAEPEQQKVWDLEHLTADDERELGAVLHRVILHDQPEVDEGPLQRRLEDAARPYLKTVARKDVKYTFTVLDSPRLNVFSHPGGYIYASRGLFDWIAEDEDYALGFILAHEIAHVDLAHAIVCLKDPEVKARFRFGTALLFDAVMIPGGYLDAQDFEADRWAAERMLKAGRTRYETLAFLRRLEDYARTNGFENRRKTPRDKPDVPPLDNHIRAHPIPRERLEPLKDLIARLQKT